MNKLKEFLENNVHYLIAILLLVSVINFFYMPSTDDIKEEFNKDSTSVNEREAYTNEREALKDKDRLKDSIIKLQKITETANFLEIKKELELIKDKTETDKKDILKEIQKLNK